VQSRPVFQGLDQAFTGSEHSKVSSQKLEIHPDNYNDLLLMFNSSDNHHVLFALLEQNAYQTVIQPIRRGILKLVS
jgi:ribonuclease HIII